MFTVGNRHKSEKAQPAAQRRATSEPSQSTPASFNPVWQALATRLQTKLTVNTPGDKYEQEADRVADQVMRMPDAGATEAWAYEGPAVQRQPIEEEEELLQPKSVLGASSGAQSVQRQPIEEEEEQLQMKLAGGSAGGPATATSVLPKGDGAPLPESARTFFEPRFGLDFSHVRVHTGAQAGASTRSLNALAYTAGDQIVFGAGQYAPHTTEGRKLLAHELTHTVQQGKSGFARKQNQPREQGSSGPARSNADRVADQVRRMSDRQLQRACACGGECPNCQAGQLGQEHGLLQTKRLQENHVGETGAPPVVQGVVRSPGQPLDSATSAFLQPRLAQQIGVLRKASAGNTQSGAAAPVQEEACADNMGVVAPEFGAAWISDEFLKTIRAAGVGTGHVSGTLVSAGSKRHQVRLVQTALFLWNCERDGTNSLPISVKERSVDGVVVGDGLFGSETKAAVVLFQEIASKGCPLLGRSLKPDGIVGPNTLCAIDNRLRSPAVRVPPMKRRAAPVGGLERVFQDAVTGWAENEEIDLGDIDLDPLWRIALKAARLAAREIGTATMKTIFERMAAVIAAILAAHGIKIAAAVAALAAALLVAPGLLERLKKLLDRKPGEPVGPDEQEDSDEERITLTLPGVKTPHLDCYRAAIGANQLSNIKGQSGSGKQRGIWDSAMLTNIGSSGFKNLHEQANERFPGHITEENLEGQLPSSSSDDASPDCVIGSGGDRPGWSEATAVAAHAVVDRFNLTLDDVLRPTWGKTGGLGARMNVDHLLEAQVFNTQSTDSPWNFQLLDDSTNKSSGKTLNLAITNERDRLGAEDDRVIVFNTLEVSGSGGGVRWTWREIQKGQHLLALVQQKGSEQDDPPEGPIPV